MSETHISYEIHSNQSNHQLIMANSWNPETKGKGKGAGFKS